MFLELSNLSLLILHQQPLKPNLLESKYIISYCQIWKNKLLLLYTSFITFLVTENLHNEREIVKFTVCQKNYLLI